MTDENQIGVGRFGGRFGFRLYAGAVGSPGAGRGGQGPEYVSGEEKNYVDGWVRIRLADDAGALRVGCFTRGAAESGQPGNRRSGCPVGCHGDKARICRGRPVR